MIEVYVELAHQPYRGHEGLPAPDASYTTVGTMWVEYFPTVPRYGDAYMYRARQPAQGKWRDNSFSGSSHSLAKGYVVAIEWRPNPDLSRTGVVPVVVIGERNPFEDKK